MDTSSVKTGPEASRATSDSRDTSDKPVSSKRKSESAMENVDSSETGSNNISPESATSSSNLASGREKRIRKIKAYDDDFLMYDLPSCSNSSLIQNLTKQIAPAQEKVEEVGHNLGDLVWAKVSGHPWWPCMISSPELSPTSYKSGAKSDTAHFKLIGGSRPKRSFYVQFFGPSVEHAWVPEGNIISYKGLAHFKAYAQEQIDKAVSKSAKEKMNEKFSQKISAPRREEWDRAIGEADSLLSKRPRDRKAYFLKQLGATDAQIPIEEPAKANKLKRNSIDEENFQHEPKKSKISAHGSTAQNESSKSTDSELSTSTITEKNPLQEKNDSNLSNIKNHELSDEELLLKIKNRLKAITLIQNNFFKIEQIAEKYNLSKDVLFYDYFGFDQHDSELSPNFIEKSYFISKIDSIKAEIDKMFKIIDKAVEDSDYNNGKQKYIQAIPKALVAVKFKVPFFFVNIICDNLNSHKNSSDDINKENSPFSGDFIDSLFGFCHKIFQHRNDMKKIFELLNESKNFNFEKKSDQIGAQETEKLDEKILQQDNLESNDQN